MQGDSDRFRIIGNTKVRKSNFRFSLTFIVGIFSKSDSLRYV